MNILLVDDDRFVINSLKKNIDWQSLQISGVFSAFNIQQAKKIISDKEIDILISDIEMPQGSGLDLLAWIRDNKLSLEVIFLTNYADFNYAQKAIELQSFEYYLKPIEFDKLQKIIQRAATKVTESKQLQGVHNVNYHKKTPSQMEEAFWINLLTSNTPSSKEDLLKQMKVENLNIDISGYFIPIIIRFFPSHVKEKESPQFHTTVKNDLTAMVNGELTIISLHKLDTKQEEYCLVVKTKSLNKFNRISFEDLLSQIIYELEEKHSWSSQFFIGKITAIEGLYSYLKELQQTVPEIVGFRNQIFSLDSPLPAVQYYQAPNVDLLNEYINNGNEQAFIQQCEFGIQSIANHDFIFRENLLAFHMDIEQLIYSYLYAKGILAHKLFKGQKQDFLVKQAFQSIEDFLNLLSFQIHTVINHLQLLESKESVVKIIQKYLDQHYQENITRAALAEIVFLSPDHIARIFKKETGYSIGNYVIHKRIQLAKDLLTNTSYPIHSISDKVGYDNYSYFTKLFKKNTSYTPLEFRNKFSRTFT